MSSVGFNYLFGQLISKHNSKHPNYFRGKLLLTVGIFANLGLLAYFKYMNFFLDNLSALSGIDLSIPKIILPIGLSFFTFQQIAFLVDSYRTEINKYKFLHYCLFVTFFPQLIAGPIVHHREILPQLEHSCRWRSRRPAPSACKTSTARGRRRMDTSS